MSFIVKGVDLPKDETIVIHYANRYGEMETVFVDESDIIQIPKKHGRLVDADKIFTYSHWEEQAVSEAPTILEEEE